MATKKVTTKATETEELPRPRSNEQIGAEVLSNLIDILDRESETRAELNRAQWERNRRAVKNMPLYFMHMLIEAAEGALSTWMRKRRDLPAEVARMYQAQRGLSICADDPDHLDDAGLAQDIEAIATGVQYVGLILNDEIEWPDFRLDLASHEVTNRKSLESQTHRIARERKLLALAEAQSTQTQAPVATGKAVKP